MYKRLKTALAVTLAGIAAISAPAHADLSANAGFVSDYYFRGANLGDAGAYVGLDYGTGGFYVGTWIINDGGDSGTTVEYDVYAGYDWESDAGFSVGVAFTTFNYEYTSNKQEEVNLYLGFGPISVEYTTAENISIGGVDGADEDYDFYAVSAGGDVFSATYGVFENDISTAADYNYLEVSAGGELGPVDVSVSFGATDPETGGNDVYIFVDVSKTFEL